jgi:deoxyribodipyrimidine photolyase-like uncharacterized protein
MFDGLAEHIQDFNPSTILTMQASEYRGRIFQESFEGKLGRPVKVLPDTQFLTGRYNPFPGLPADKRIRQESFYRQYHRQMPGLDRSNFWQAERPLPSWFWDGENPMNCLRRVIRRVLEDGYCHYIERLMVISNFCQLAGIQQGYRPTQRLEPPGIPVSHLAVPNRMGKPAGEPLLAADSNWQEIGDAQADCA